MRDSEARRQVVEDETGPGWLRRQLRLEPIHNQRLPRWRQSVAAVTFKDVTPRTEFYEIEREYELRAEWRTRFFVKYPHQREHLHEAKKRAEGKIMREVYGGLYDLVLELEEAIHEGDQGLAIELCNKLRDEVRP